MAMTVGELDMARWGEGGCQEGQGRTCLCCSHFCYLTHRCPEPCSPGFVQSDPRAGPPGMNGPLLRPGAPGTSSRRVQCPDPASSSKWPQLIHSPTHSFIRLFKEYVLHAHWMTSCVPSSGICCDQVPLPTWTGE